MRFSSIVKSSQDPGCCNNIHCCRVTKSSFRSKKWEQRSVRRYWGITGLHCFDRSSIRAFVSLIICALTSSLVEICFGLGSLQHFVKIKIRTVSLTTCNINRHKSTCLTARDLAALCLAVKVDSCYANMEISFSSVPVTALQVCDVDGHVFVFSGQGSRLHVHDSKEKQVILRQRVFVSEAIHGISVQTPLAIKPGETGIRLLLWAGSATAILFLSLVKGGAQDSARNMMLTLTELCIVDVCEWVLFGDFLELEPREKIRAYIVTAHNEVREIILDEHSDNRSKTLSCVRLVSGPRSVLYSAYARSTSTGLLVAAGTVFGEVVVWSANKNEFSDAWCSKILNVLLGHKGSIFGVCISEDLLFDGKHRRLLATCSDDRSIRLWNINDEVESMIKTETDSSKQIQLSDVTGFNDLSRDSQSLLAVAWGHLSRIWTVKFLPTDYSSETKRVNLVSTGEDASFRVWEAAIDGASNDNKCDSIQLRETASYTNHFGKNIWSSDYHVIEGKYIQYTGGADGLIVATTLRNAADMKVNSRYFRTHISFDDISHQSEVNDQRHTSSSRSTTMALKQYAFADDGSIFATTAKGELLHGKFTNEDEEISWHNLHAVESKSPLLLCSDRGSGSVFFATAGGTLFSIEEGSGTMISSSIAVAPQATFMCVAPTEGHTRFRKLQSSILIPVPNERCVTLIVVLIAGSVSLQSSARLKLPVNFVPTSGCHHVQQDLLVLGSRSGSIAIFDLLVDFETAAVVFSNLHGADTVTSIVFLDCGSVPSKQLSAEDLYILTTGRDGSYAVHMISRSSAEAGTWTLQTVHRSSPPIGPNVEGAYLARTAAGQSQKLLLYGFKSKDFVVWNETAQTEVLAVDCGGAHRSWAYSPLKDDISGETLHGGTFTWTKAGACNVYRKSDEDYHRVQLGGHGREIKALAVSPLRLNVDSPGLDNAFLVATGAEDTTIRLFAVKICDLNVSDQAENKMTCIHTLNKHTTGIHHLEFSPCGSYLFSSGGCEELFVWRLHTGIPVIGLGLVLECMLPKTEADSDARITSFKVERQSEPASEFVDGAEMDFEIAATYSNGKIKIFSYSCEQGSHKGYFKLLEEVIEGSFCLTQLHYDAKHEIMLTAGTNGFINVHFPQRWNFLWKQQVHQNSIQASILVKVPGFSSKWFLVTGGDDNALGLTIFCPDAASSSRSISAFRTLLIPNAHAAAVTGLTLISPLIKRGENTIMNFVSVSNDQRVKIWCVTICDKEVCKRDIEIEDVQIRKVTEFWTNVADAAAVRVLNRAPSHEDYDTGYAQTTEEFSQELLVVGVGMEILKVPLPS